MGEPVKLTPMHHQILAILRRNAAAPNPDGLSVPAIAWTATEEGERFNAGLREVAAAVLELHAAGLVRHHRGHAADGRRLCRKYRLTAAGHDLIQANEAVDRS